MSLSGRCAFVCNTILTIYRASAPTLWCPECQTAIAQAETEDKESKSVFYDIDFELADGRKVTIATTRPELLPACQALCVHPTGDRYRKLVGTRARVPLFGQEVPVLADHRADPEKGTGVVMCCTFGDTVDIDLPMSLRTESMPDNADRISCSMARLS